MRKKCEQLSRYLVDLNSMSDIFLCGPEQMVACTRNWLLKKEVTKEKIHFELFTVPGEKARLKSAEVTGSLGKHSRVTIKLDGVRIVFLLPYDGRSILDGALQQGADLPYACKGGVCATCRAKLVSGEVEMDNNYALEAEELASGYILTCQSHPRTDEVEIDFDTR